MKFTLALWRGNRENTRKVGSPRSYHATLYFLNKKKEKKKSKQKKKDFFQSNASSNIHETLCAIWYHWYNLKNMKNMHGRVLLLVVCNFTKSNTHPRVLFTFFKSFKWSWIAQSIANGFLDVNRSSKQHTYTWGVFMIQSNIYDGAYGNCLRLLHCKKYRNFN